MYEMADVVETLSRRAIILQKTYAGIIAMLATLLLYALSPQTITRLELALYDAALPLRASKAPSDVPVIIDIDEYTLETVRQWPWPRYLVADLTTALKREGVAAIAFDVMFSERDNSSPSEITDYLERRKGVDVKFEGLPGELWNYDALLASALRVAPVVLAVYAGGNISSDIPDTVRIMERRSPGAPDGDAYTEKIPNMSGAVLPLPEFRSADLGVINIEPDMDGIIRKIPLIVAVQGKIYPTLSLRTLLTALNTENMTLGLGVHGLEYIKAGSYTIPTAPDGTMLIPFIGPQWTYEYVSAADALLGNLAPGSLEGRVAFVGSSARGLVDLHPTPLDPVCPGVETHAAVFDAIVTGNVITKPVRASFIQAVMIIAAGIISAWLFGFARPMVYVPAAAAFMTAIVAASSALFANGVYISPVYALITVVDEAAVLLLVRFRQEEVQKLLMAAVLADERARRAKEQADLDTARRIQESALTRDFPPYENFTEVEVYASMKPAQNVGGDFYDCFPVRPGRLAIVIADVSGKGIPAALFMMAAKAVIKNQALLGDSPNEILTAANDIICRENDAGMFVTAFVGIYDAELETLEYANAGHNPPVLLRDGAKFIPVERNFVLGGFEGLKYEPEAIHFGESDAIVLYTDGVTEMMNCRAELFGDNRLIKLLDEIPTKKRREDLKSRDIVEAIAAEVEIFADGAAPSDDVTILALRHKSL
jgi:serine phosphatase RsbU (regulator of sigma subunit)/CHASE2 domain-containing sensor protein